jgi:glycosyltransferase involved in cell wall biosynthesis
MFLFIFDYYSTIERKNPVGLIEAFKQAFAPGEGPVLVVKSINGHNNRGKREALRHAASGRSDILLVDEFYSPEHKSGIVSLCDAYVSLHRGEGFGLGMAEAMALGKPTIGTRYSGNLAFMDDQNSYLVDFELGTVPEGAGPYPAGSEWANPDVDHAARLMRFVYDYSEEAIKRGDQGRNDVLSKMTLDQASVFVKGRLDTIAKEISMRQTDHHSGSGRTRNGLRRARSLFQRS